jgi:hypothetical protein
MRNEMLENEIGAAGPMASFLLECLAFNVPNDLLTMSSYANAVRFAIAYLYEHTVSFDKCSEWGEVNELKYLFRSSQPWTYQQANAFLVAAWNYAGFA